MGNGWHKKAIPICAGCGQRPPDRPSYVLCRACMDGISDKMDALIDGMNATNPAPDAGTTGGEG